MGQRSSRPARASESAGEAVASTSTSPARRGPPQRAKRSVLGLASAGLDSLRKRKPTMSRASSSSTAGTARGWRRWSRAARVREEEGAPAVPARSPSPSPNPAPARPEPPPASGSGAEGGPLPPAGTLVVVQGVVHTTDVAAAGAGMPTLSPTSIDVLGTLLSVATAATAASLVTGSSAPLFSSGLEPAPSPLGPASAPESAPHVQSTPLLSPEHERMRSAWGSIRDRFGIGRAPSPSTPEPAPADDDARSQLLADMARAFHLGMGLDDPDPSPAAPIAEEPAEGSFERFLLDLQTDLRGTLGGPVDGGRMPTPPPARHIPGPSAESEDEVHSRRTAPSRPVAEGEGEHDNDNVFDFAAAGIAPPPHTLDPPSDDEGIHFADDGPITPHIDLGRAHDQPPRLLHGQSSLRPTPPAAGQQERGINWWRMYRFPPMRVPTTPTPSTASHPTGDVPDDSQDTVGAAEMGFDPRPTLDGEGNGPPPPLVDLESTPRPPMPYPSSSDGDRNGNGGELSIVVPVIVVGLQSLHGHGHRPPPFAGSSAEDEWTARAADAYAYRGLRRSGEASERASGERRESADASASASSGAEEREEQHGDRSTTFFIYVIGGYYPPTHPLVTGAPNTALDSFEALWELADLLGPAKPPTATREDIVRAGLKVIKPREMREMASEGDVVEACVERCLVCLEDYADEDDLRLLGCRHIFHKACVDTWLETGRNNCPACRAQGVQRAVDRPVSA